MEEKQTARRVVVMALAGVLVGTLLFLFAFSLQSHLLLIIVHYLIAMILYLCSFLAVWKHYRSQHVPIDVYLMILIVVFALLISYAVIVQ